MTSTLFDDLGERLDTIADAHTSHLELRHPDELPIGRTPDAESNRILWLAAAAILVLVAAVWLGLRDGADLETEEPAADPAVTTELAYGDLPALFSYDPLPADHPAVVAKAEWWDPTTVRTISFDGADVYVASPVDNDDLLCIDVQTAAGAGFTAEGEGSCVSVSGYLAGFPLLLFGEAPPRFVAGLLPLGATGVGTSSSGSSGGLVQMDDGLYFAELDSPGALVQPVGGEDERESRGTISGVLGGVAFDDELTAAACISSGDTWSVSGRSTNFLFRFGPDNGGVGPAFDSSTYAGVLLETYTLSGDASSGALTITVEFDQDDTRGTVAVDCRYVLDWAEFSAGWFGS